MRNNRDVPAMHINLSDCVDRVDALEAFFERHSEWFLGDTIVIAEGPPVSRDEKQVPVEHTLRFLAENSTYHAIRKHLLFAPAYAFCFSAQHQKARLLARAWFLFDRLKIITVSKCEMQAFERLSFVFSLDEDPVFEPTKYVAIGLKGEFDSDLHLLRF